MINYEDKLQQQFKNAQLETHQIYFKNLYGQISKKLRSTDKILEIGAGAGISSLFINRLHVDRTDWLSWEENELVKGGIDAENLPYPDSFYDAVIGVDVLHHLNSPVKALQEIDRVLKNGGRAYFIEPYVSPVSFIVYKIFHEEETSFKYNLFKAQNKTESYEGDQGVAKALFCTKTGQKLLNEKVKHLQNLEMQFLHPISFYLTGGLTNPINTGKKLITLLLRIETFIPKHILKMTASRMYVEFVAKK